jgi:hypothetical protein
MENAVAVVERYDMTQDAMTPDTMVRQITLIQHVMEKVMKDGEHYGVIPGCGKKPSLLKAGAEKLSLTFRLAPSYVITQSDLPGGHREYNVRCTLTHIPTGKVFGEGVGACSTMEGKYRYRTGEVELTDKEVPKDYWTNRDQNLIGGKGFSTKKNEAGKWVIARAGEKVEHDNPADYYNTVLKMAKKRSHVDAVLTATAASDIFTQDVEDMVTFATPAKNDNPVTKDYVEAEYTPAAAPAPEAAPAAPAPPADDEDEVFVKIESVESKEGTTNGRKWTAYFIKTATGGKYGTFNKAFADLANTYKEEGKLVRIVHKPGKKAGSRELVSIEDDAA